MWPDESIFKDTSSRAQRHNTAAKDINLITVRHHPSRPMEVLLPKAMAALLPKATAVRRVMADISRDISKLRLQTTAVVSSLVQIYMLIFILK
jgi:hypothetical protein